MVFIIWIKLDTLGYAGAEQPAKIIYHYGNGKFKIILEPGTISVNALFQELFKGE